MDDGKSGKTLGIVAQWLDESRELPSFKRKVTGSSPVGLNKFYGDCSQNG